jgi:hypothetical protein
MRSRSETFTTPLPSMSTLQPTHGTHEEMLSSRFETLTIPFIAPSAHPFSKTVKVITARYVAMP